MLYFSLFAGLAVLATVNKGVRVNNDRQGIVPPIALFGFVAMSFLLGAAFLPALGMQACGLVIIWLVWKNMNTGPSVFHFLSVAVSVLAFAGAAWVFSVPELLEQAELRARYPIESIAARLPARAPQGRSVLLSAAAESAIKNWEEDNLGWNSGQRRSRSLRILHENTVQLFVDSPGFGVTRMLNNNKPSKYGIEPSPEREIAIQQPGERITSSATGDLLSRNSKESIDATIRKTHEEGVSGFVVSRDFGYIKSRDQVAGFLPHRFIRLPASPPTWNMQTLDLVGLVVHPEPVVYASDRLPAMDELKSAPKRAPDEFETAGLDALRNGELLFMRESSTAMRLLGAVRAANQCTTCHACDRGELLGAFSYTFKRVEPVMVPGR